MARHVYGVGPVRELVTARPGAVKALLVEPGRARKGGRDPVAELAATARAAGIRVDERARAELDRLCGPDARHQGVVAVTGELTYVDVDDLVAAATARGEAPLIVVLDGVQDPHNLGAVIRSAYVLGAHGVVIPEHRAAAVTPTVTKASAGATELLPIAMAGNLTRALEALKAAGVWTCAVASGPGARPLAEVLAGLGDVGVALVLGAEGSGVRPLVARTCDLHAEIPMGGAGVGSLNVSVAAGIAIYEAMRARRG
ncbi:MAG: 23S rRNA (guanosine(2251)-2'-O)-methyltransferase RlmB [Kofleriaceae bacterium]|nr:23S rRNA (guanosine(2251)-2'-O)-methyltransferase RlmB [Kofleriaceae bacterium]